MRYTSHLDLQRALDRTFRRAHLRLSYSQGYNPRPRISLASALPLGFTSEAERLEAWLDEDLPLEEILGRLQESAPPGIQFKAIELIPQRFAKLPNRIVSSEYRAYLYEPCPELEDRISRIMSSESLPRERNGKNYDLRPLIEALLVSKERKEEGQVLDMRLAARPGATGRPEEILDALDLPRFSARMTRIRLVMDDED